MTRSLSSSNLRTPATASIGRGLALLALAGCTHVNLNAPPVEDWSSSRGAQAVRSVPAVDTYTVQRNDTLASIAQRIGTAPASLAAWNNLPANARVAPGQVLRVTPPAAGSVDSAPVATTSPIGSEGVEQRPLGQAPTASTALPSSSSAPLKSTPLGVKKPYSDAALAELAKPDGDVPAAAPPVSSPTASSGGGSALTWAWPTGGKPSTVFGNGQTKGIDIPGRAGDAVLAAGDGKVTFVGAGVRGYGNFLIVRHTPELLSVYAHNRLNLVKEGDTVTRGQKIAEMGATESDAVKLHFEIRSDSKPVDPLKYLPER